MARNVEELAALAVDCGLRLHRELGPGLLESVYEAVLAASLAKAGVIVERQKPISFCFDGMVFSRAFAMDLFLDDLLVIEVKSTEAIAKVHGKQLLTYLRLADRPLGLLMNFGAATFREGVRRVVNRHTNFASSRLRVHNSGEVEEARSSWDDFFDGPPCPDFPDRGPQGEYEIRESF